MQGFSGHIKHEFGLVVECSLYLTEKLTHSEQCHITKAFLSLKQMQARKQVQLFPCWRGAGIHIEAWLASPA